MYSARASSRLTATPAVTVALHDGDTVVAESTVVDARRHGELVAPGIARVLTETNHVMRDVTDVAVGVGPGPFTGLRVGLVTAQVLAATLGIPVHGVCTLDVLAWDASVDGPFAVATDARRREVYWARFTNRTNRVTEPAVDRPMDVAPLVEGLPVLGEGPRLYPTAFPLHAEPSLPTAAALASLAVVRIRAGGKGLLPPHPLYLRRPDAVEPAARKRVTPA